jgi:hypothetical protein
VLNQQQAAFCCGASHISHPARSGRMLSLRRLVKFRGPSMHPIISTGPLVSLIAGILILVFPRLLNYIVALYLIIIGLLGLFGGYVH